MQDMDLSKTFNSNISMHKNFKGPNDSLKSKPNNFQAKKISSNIIFLI